MGGTSAFWDVGRFDKLGVPDAGSRGVPPVADRWHPRDRPGLQIRASYADRGLDFAVRAYLFVRTQAKLPPNFSEAVDSTMSPHTTCLRVLATLLLTVAMSAHAGDKPATVKYVAPDGFDGHPWGQLQASAAFARLPLRAIGVGAAWMRPVEKEVSFTCVPAGGPDSQMGGMTGGCDLHATLQTMRKTFEGGGFYVLSEYTIEDQGARFGSGADSVVMHPVIYQFCANWDSTKRELPPAFDETNRFCGVRLMFETETPEALRNLPADHMTRYDRVLEKLIARFGKPDNFRRRGKVVIETLDGESAARSERKFRIWRWCPARDRGLHTRCTASVVLSIEPATGHATVLYSTPLLWQFAYAREYNGNKGDRLFKLLHARK
jgi:hypothetical protein